MLNVAVHDSHPDILHLLHYGECVMEFGEVGELIEFLGELVDDILIDVNKLTHDGNFSKAKDAVAFGKECVQWRKLLILNGGLPC